jgi:hypothetical protein
VGDAVFYGVPEFQQINPQKHQGLTGGTRPFLEEGYDDMFRKELIRVKTAGFLLSVNG